MKYYPFVKNWAKIKPHLEDELFLKILTRDFNKYTSGRWKKAFKKGMKPFDFESCDWHCERKGRRPQYWDYVKHAACHWLVNANLRLATLAEPNQEWQIVTSQKHSTVWNGNDILFDMNFSALQVDPQEGFDLAYFEGDLLEIGQYMKTYMASHYSKDKR